MIVVEDLLDELNVLDDDHWSSQVTTILQTLSFPVNYSYCCRWEEFLFEKTNRLRFAKKEERNTLTLCEEIVGYDVEAPYSKIKIYAIRILNKKGLRNDIAYEITKAFHKLFGEFIVLAFVSCEELAFSGVAVGDDKHHFEVYLSDWFGIEEDWHRNEELLEVDFALFSNKSINDIYENYLWAIARPYMRIRESKMYLIFGCDDFVEYELLVPNSDGFGEVLIEKIDRDETLKKNSEYYMNFYDKDYFLDRESFEEEDISLYENEDDIDFEWTMLELELANEADEYEETFHDDLDEDSKEYSIGLGLDPGEMLEYIKSL